MSKRKRPTDDYLRAAQKLAVYAPSLKKYKRRKTLKPHEKAAIARKEKLLQFAHHLIPVTKKQAHALKGQLFGPGIRAVKLENTGPTTHIQSVGKARKDITVISNGRTWLYWTLEKFKTSDMARAGQMAFNVRDAFPIEKIAALAERAFKRPKTKEVYLWTKDGRVGEGFEDLTQFMRWLAQSYGGYTEPSRWIHGLAIRITN